MYVLDVFERVNLIAPISERKFLAFFNDTLAELLGLYGSKYVLNEGAIDVSAPKIDHDIYVFDVYMPCIVDNILYFISREADYKQEFIRGSNTAYLSIWNELNVGKKFKARGW